MHAVLYAETKYYMLRQSPGCGREKSSIHTHTHIYSCALRKCAQKMEICPQVKVPTDGDVPIYADAPKSAVTDDSSKACFQTRNKGTRSGGRMTSSDVIDSQERASQHHSPSPSPSAASFSPPQPPPSSSPPCEAAAEPPAPSPVAWPPSSSPATPAPNHRQSSSAFSQQTYLHISTVSATASSDSPVSSSTLSQQLHLHIEVHHHQHCLNIPICT